MYLLEEGLKFPKDSFKSMKYQPYEMKPSFSMVRVYQWWNYWYGEVYISFSGGLDRYSLGVHSVPSVQKV